jgi:two-component sensor histidine kinase
VDFPALEPKARQALAGVASAVEDEFTLSDGQRRVMLVQRVPDKTSDGTVHGYFVVCTDVTESKRAEQARLEEERRFREALIAEVHHRVKNSLQGVVGLLRSQSEQRPELAAALEPAISQVMAISVGFGLMSTRGLRGIVLCDVVREVGRNLSQITAANVETTLSESVTRDPIELDQAHAVNLSLVINELTFNAIKHQTGSASPVQVRLDRTKESVTIQIWSATGRLPDRFDFESGAGLGTGLSLVRLLLPRRGCTLSYSSRDGGVVATVALELGALGPPN